MPSRAYASLLQDISDTSHLTVAGVNALTGLCLIATVQKDPAKGYKEFCSVNACVLSIENPQNRKENSPLSDREIPIIRKKHVESFRFFHLSSRKESSIHCFLPNRVIRVRLCQRLPERFAFNVLSLGHPVPVPGKKCGKAYCRNEV